MLPWPDRERGGHAEEAEAAGVRVLPGEEPVHLMDEGALCSVP